MPSRFRSIALLIAVTTAVALPLSAQDWKGRGRLTGIVTSEGQPVEGATVTVKKEGTGDGPEPIKTDKKGRWAMGGLATGTWEVTVELPGYVPAAGSTKVIEGNIPSDPIRIELRPAQQATPQASPRDLAVKRGNQLLKEGKYAEAREEYEQALAETATEKVEDKAAILFGIGQAYAGEAKNAEAIAALEQSLSLKSGDQPVIQLLVRVLNAAGRAKEAQEYLAKLPEGSSMAPDMFLNMGIDKYNANDMTGALEIFDKVVSENPDLADAYYYRARVYLTQEKYSEAKADFQKFLELAPDDEKAAEAKEFVAGL
jgi:Tfp pilus assembly protein PilF